ncbi:MAG: hypothetical protein JO319_06110 [Acidobacteriaceae bacterium]|nr:hypothetical protein [Acidobacteriaceae bacterium]
MSKAVLVLILISAVPCAAQYPGQYPPGGYPPGQYPPGQGPTGGSGIPMPSRHKKDRNKTSDASQPTISAEGKTVSNDGRKLVVDTQDGRELTMAVTPQTKFTRSGSDIPGEKIIPRTTVHVEAAQDNEANLTVVSVELLKDAPPEMPEARTSTGGQRGADGAGGNAADDDVLTRPTILKDPNEPADRPILKHGQSTYSPRDDDSGPSGPTLTPPRPASTQTAQTKPQTDAQHDSGDFTIDGEKATVQRIPGQELVDRTKDWAVGFTQGLPNFVCQQMTTRYMEQSRSDGWQPLDVVTAKVVYEDGKEEYRDITVGGRRTNKSMLELGGSTSTGEFASTLRSLFSQGSRAEFKLVQSTTVNGSAAAIYDFKVALRNSDWYISVGGQALRPAYSGSVWIDKASAEVRRIEMQADNIPKDFPLDSIQWAVDYDEVSLGTSKFLLPVHADNLGCQRGSPICTKNSTDFRDYHKYTGESTITFK